MKIKIGILSSLVLFFLIGLILLFTNQKINAQYGTKDLIVANGTGYAFKYPGGIRGSTGTPTIYIKNIGNTAITGNFNVKICNGNGTCATHTVTQVVSADELINLSGSSEFQNMALGSPAGSYTATATVDAGNNITEDNENNNVQQDAYSTTNPNCNSGTSCGACSTVCGAGSQACTYTTYSGGGACNVVSAPSQGCNPSCAAGQICSANSCIYPTCNTGVVCGACSTVCGAGSQACTYTTYNWAAVACTQTPAPSQSCNPSCAAGQICSANSCVTPTCNAGVVCGACNVQCGTGSQSCTYTTYNGSASCNQTPAPPQSCSPTCSGGTPNCVSNVCVCSAPAIPTGLAPSGTLYGDQTLNISWNAVAGATSYAIRVDDLANGWNCAGAGTPGDVCTDIAGTAYSYNFQAGHSYNIWVHSRSACGTYSGATSTSVTTLSYIWGHIYIDTNNNSLQDAGEANLTSATVTKTGGSTETFTSDAGGNYIFWENAGTYTVSIAPGGNYAIYPSSSQTTSVGPSRVLSFRLVPLSYIWGHVWIDNNNDGAENAGDSAYVGLNVAMSGANSGNFITDAGGNYGFWSQLPGGYTITIPTPAGYTVPVTQQSTTLPPDRVLSFRLIPTAFFNPKGNHDAASCSVTTGWTCDPDNYAQAIDVHFYKDGPAGAGGTFMGAVNANLAREAAVGALCGGNSNHGFSYNIPASIYDGVAHTIYAYAINIGGGTANPLLTSSPKTVTCSRSIVNIHVYNDNNGNGVEDAGETGSSNKTVAVAGNGAGSYTTNASGNIQITNLLPGSSTATVTLPAGWSSTTANPATAFYPPTPTQLNFGIKPPAPTCSGGLTASLASVNPGQTSTLTAVGCTSSTGQVPTYTYFDDATIAGDSVSNNNTNTSTWTSPNPYWTAVTAHPSVAVCNPGGAGALCTNYSTDISIVPLYSVSGNVFEDINKDGLKNGGDSNYEGGITITRNPASGSAPTYPASGQYTINNLPAGSYTIAYTGLPGGYTVTYPSVVPIAFNVTVGAACSVGGSNSASCSNGNITNLNYGIIYGSPWIQTGGSDLWFNTQVDNSIPSSANCNGSGPYMSEANSSNSPGIIYSSGSISFGQGQASVNNWYVQNSPFTPVTPNSIRSSYSYMTALISQNHITPIDLTTVCANLSNCTLPNNLANGVYTANGSVTLRNTYTFPANKNFVFLIKGSLTINNDIHVPTATTVLFSALNDINVGSNVGEAQATSKNSNLEGWYSAGEDFVILGGATCPAADRRLNVAGAIVVNAELQGGSFLNQRDLCAGNLTCPVFYITERPDFTLNAPPFLQAAPRIWQEVAP